MWKMRLQKIRKLLSEALHLAIGMLVSSRNLKKKCPFVKTSTASALAAGELTMIPL
jgi:hypothetical protein